jgi:hypothetical protein
VREALRDGWHPASVIAAGLSILPLESMEQTRRRATQDAFINLWAGRGLVKK